MHTLQLMKPSDTVCSFEELGKGYQTGSKLSAQERALLAGLRRPGKEEEHCAESHPLPMLQRVSPGQQRICLCFLIPIRRRYTATTCPCYHSLMHSDMFWSQVLGDAAIPCMLRTKAERE